MLVLTRKHQEKIRIGDDIVITVLRTKGKAVRLGIEAPSTVPVIRGELAFESPDAPQAVETNGIPMESDPAAAAATVRRNRGATTRPATSWSTATAPDESTTPAFRDARVNDSQVSLRRVAREKLAGMLPRISSESGPLRPLLDQRLTM